MLRTFWKVPKKCFNVAELQKAVLPKLDYNYEDLEPVLSKEVVEIHHTKHHQAYIDNYNRLIPQLHQAIANGETEKIVTLTKDIKFNGGSHINHSIYWKNLAPIKSKYNF
jgi:superoxide dismutase, Fe-Mn family